MYEVVPVGLGSFERQGIGLRNATADGNYSASVSGLRFSSAEPLVELERLRLV
ncbi:hypothetical protein BH20ACT11_BH20ACT11_15780 [soil metagenome]|jgi:hypothetical protein